MRLGVITDEIDPDLESALRVARELGVAEVELNRMDGVSSGACSAELAERAEGLLREGDFRVCAVGTMAFKSLLLDGVKDSPEEDPEFEKHLGWVRRGCELAARFGAGVVRVFSFRKSGMRGYGNPSPRLPRGGPISEAVLPKIVTGLRLAAEVAERAGVDLAVENVRSCWGNSCWNSAAILKAAAHERLKAVWDPANDYVSGGDPYPEGYEALQPWIAHVHVKNASLADAATGRTRWERIGVGALDYAPLLQRLKDDGYQGAVTLETHWRGEGLSQADSSRASFQDLKRLWDKRH